MMDLRAAAVALGLDVHPKSGNSESWVVIYTGGGERWAARSDNPTCELYIAAVAARRFTEWTLSEMDETRVPYKWECVGLTGDLEKHKGKGDTWSEALIEAALKISEE